MGEVQSFFLKVGFAFAAALILSGINLWLARRKGRDTVGWFLNGFFPSLVGFLMVVFAFPGRLGWMLVGGFLVVLSLVVLLLLPGRETPGQTKRCPVCDKLVSWKAAQCPACGAALKVASKDPGVKVKRPLRTFYLLLFLTVLLLLIVFGFIGYFCVPN